VPDLYRLVRPLLRALPPETAHRVTIAALAAGLGGRPREPDPPSLRRPLWGLDFPNPIGIAAGFDKDARVPDAVLGMGFGFAEIGSVTPLPQAGNPRPRVFRLIEDGALINRLGFNNGGHAQALARLEARRATGVVGVNVGANKDAADRAGDYAAGVRTFADVASYFTINVSSPNTPSLRDLQAPAALDDLLARVLAARAEVVAADKSSRPVVVKLAPDIAEGDLEPIVRVLIARGVDGIAVSNSTLARKGVSDTEYAAQAGGLSGPPLFHRSTVVLARVHVLTAGRIPLVGIGGIDSGAAAIAKIEAGASLLQLYTGLVFHGPGLLARIKRDLIAYADRYRLAHITDAAGSQAKAWAAKALDA
jgi:dihydroorotate dehydrogenase